MSVAIDLIKQLEVRSPLPPLCPKETWKPELTKQIDALSESELIGQDNPSNLAVLATLSGLLLWNDDLDTSHAISQQIEEPIGSYWHGIMHRREGDFSNAKYWFSLVGDYPTFEELYEKGSAIYPAIQEWGSWDPYRFIDEVEDVVTNNLEDTTRGEQLRRLQVLEIALLVENSLKQ